MTKHWDYLIVTASMAAQAAAYRYQLGVRRTLGLLCGVKQVLVVEDPAGIPVGTAGSTILCLLAVLNRELLEQNTLCTSVSVWAKILGRLRILIVHGGGDSRGLLCYGPFGKVFTPLPGGGESALGSTLFDRQIPLYLDLPAGDTCNGQVVITSGDVLLEFPVQDIKFTAKGFTGLACFGAPEQAMEHGVYCLNGTGQVRRFLQKPSLSDQVRYGVPNGSGRPILDVGVFSMDAPTAVALLEMCEVHPDSTGSLSWGGPLSDEICRNQMDFYREICCGLGSESTMESYRATMLSNGVTWETTHLEKIFRTVSTIPFHVEVLPRCRFLHFGSVRQLLANALEIQRREETFASLQGCLSINNRLSERASVEGGNAWVEGCLIENALVLGSNSGVVGADIHEVLRLPPGSYLDLLPGRNRDGKAVTFVRCYHDDDGFSAVGQSETTLCGLPLEGWLKAAAATTEDIWAPTFGEEQRTAWSARLFPAVDTPGGYGPWLWMLQPRTASAADFLAWRRADRYSLEEMTALGNWEEFHVRRVTARLAEVRRNLHSHFHCKGGFSAADVAYIFEHTSERVAWVAELLALARQCWENGEVGPTNEAFAFSRIIHSLGTALVAWTKQPQARLSDWLPGLEAALDHRDAAWLVQLNLDSAAMCTVGEWADRAHKAAFRDLQQRIVTSGDRKVVAPINALRSDEIVWGRAPARLDLAGGWTDTPPYTLEHGGSVLNTAVLLNGQPPVQAFARVTPEPWISLRSIDLGTQTYIRDWSELLDYGNADSEFSLVKAALVLCGLGPPSTGDSHEETLRERLLRFGGGLEFTTLAALPKGSGLGTSSIMGAVLLGVIHRVMGRELSQRELFHGVLRLEQVLTTGGGWQDQVGGAIGGVKLITTTPGIIPEPTIHYVPADVLCPRSNNGCTLLYYTGITRLAKNILQEVVGRYLDREREGVAVLGKIAALVPQISEAMSRKDLPAFGRLIQVAWQLKKRLDPHSSTDKIEVLLSRIDRHVHGATLLGAGGGGFLLLVCKSPADASALRADLEASPPNPRARFFDFSVSTEGLTITVC